MSKVNILVKTAERLGIQDSSTIQKAEELLRTFQAKSSIKTISDIAKTILCLELSCNYSGDKFDKETALKLSGLKKAAYRANLHIIEKVLELDKILTVPNLCVQLNCTVIKELAEEILDKYKSSDNKLKDLTHPQYVAAVVYTACKLKNVKINKSQFIQISRLKPAQWKELVLEFEKFVTAFGICSPRKKRNTDFNYINEYDPENQINTNKNEEIEVESYEVWKKRILDEAFNALENGIILKEQNK